MLRFILHKRFPCKTFTCNFRLTRSAAPSAVNYCTVANRDKFADTRAAIVVIVLLHFLKGTGMIIAELWKLAFETVLRCLCVAFHAANSVNFRNIFRGGAVPEIIILLADLRRFSLFKVKVVIICGSSLVLIRRRLKLPKNKYYENIAIVLVRLIQVLQYSLFKLCFIGCSKKRLRYLLSLHGTF